MVDKAAEREIAAALESVFPRVGLKSFVRLEPEEKSAQLMELAKIVLGIRLFNREEDRGGAGLDDMDINATKLATALAQDIEHEVGFFTDACRCVNRFSYKLFINIITIIFIIIITVTIYDFCGT